MAPTFLFATGVENSAPTIQQGRVRIDELEACGHYTHWRTDFALVQELGIRFLRYGPPLHRTYLGPGHYDWSFADETFADLRAKDIAPITDLCHFGVPDWIGTFQNPDFPALFADYARAFATRFPWVQLYTPINEMYICATFSASYGWWNEQLTSDRAFVTALKHIVKANVLAMRAILDVRPDAIFIQSESSEYFHAESPSAIKPAEILNARRFLSLDLNYGWRVDSEMYEFLMDNGMTRNVLRVRNDGIPVVGFTWYSLTDQVDWDTGLREQNHHVNPLGLYDLDRNIRPVGTAYKQLIKDWRAVLPTQSVCLRVPVVMPSEYATDWAQRQQWQGHVQRAALPTQPANADTEGGPR